jgi:CelD/BcsL family acetyltransferase involved in cellulose biosynthesis
LGAPHVYGSPEDTELPDEALVQWDGMAVREHLPDASSGGSAWQISALGASRRRANPVIFRQAPQGQIAFSLSRIGKALKLEAWEAHWKFASPLLGEAAVELFDETVSDLRQRLPDVPISIEVSGLPEGKPPRALTRRFEPCSWREHFSHAAASLDGGIEGWRSRRTAGFRRGLRRTTSRAEAAGLTFERCAPTTQDEADDAYTRMLAVERMSWKGKCRSGLIAVQGFYGALLRRYALHNQARIIFTREDERDVGFCFGGVIGGSYRGQQTSYVEEVAALGVGNLMHVETARWLCDEGAQLQHFGPIQFGMAYKTRFCELKPKSFILQLLA